MKTTTDRIRQITNLALIPLGIALNYVAVSRQSMEVAARVDEPVLAASGWAFSIWGLIFAGQMAYALYQALPSQTDRELHRKIGWNTALNGLFGGVWTVAFTNGAFTLAWFVMLALLVNLALIELQTRAHREAGATRYFVRFPFALNFGWITVATLLDTAHFFKRVVGYSGEPLTPVIWAHILVATAVLVAILMVWKRQNGAFALAVAWGLVGIAAYRQATVPTLAVFALGSAVLLIGLVSWRLIFRRTETRGPRPTHRRVTAAAH